MIRLALVGYTNVGKSTIMNALSKSTVLAENKLFATLDTTVRKVAIGHVPFIVRYGRLYTKATASSGGKLQVNAE